MRAALPALWPLGVDRCLLKRAAVSESGEPHFSPPYSASVLSCDSVQPLKGTLSHPLQLLLSTACMNPGIHCLMLCHAVTCTDA